MFRGWNDPAARPTILTGWPRLRPAVSIMRARFVLYIAIFALASVAVTPAEISPVDPVQALCYLDPERPVGGVMCIVGNPVDCAVRTYKALGSGQPASCPTP